MYSSRHGDQRRSIDDLGIDDLMIDCQIIDNEIIDTSESSSARKLCWGAPLDCVPGLPVDQILQFLARLEVGHLLRRHVHLVAGLRITALARLALPQPEAAEAAQLDLLASVQRFDDALEYGVDNDFGMLLRQIGDPGHFLHELRLGHAAAS